MESPEQPPQKTAPSEVTEHENNFEQALSEVEEWLQNLRNRHQQIQTAQRQRQQLQEQWHQPQADLEQLKEQLEILEIELESRLITWKDRREWFWQFLRLAGLGFILALVLDALQG